MPAPNGFRWERRTGGDVAIFHHGTLATVLRGKPAERLVTRIEAADDLAAQHLMARATGNYRRGNERQA